MRIDDVPLLEGRREFATAILLWGILFLMHTGWLYYSYTRFVNRPFAYLWGTVVQTYPHAKKLHDTRLLLKVEGDDGLLFYLRSSHPDLRPGQRLRLQIFPDRVGFFAYLKGPFLPARIKEIRPPEPNLISRLRTFIDRQHSRSDAASFYRAIFFADPVDRKLHERISALGAGHLVALSGLHLSILWGGLFLLLSPVYRFFQVRYFPWRYTLIDLGSFTLLLLAGYLWLTGPPPSLLRSYAMLLIGWSALLLGIELLSFTFLGVVTALLLLYDPRLILSTGFRFSVAGVFYIYLLLKYWGRRSPRLFTLLILPIGLFFLMLPLGHTVFSTVSPWQALSPLLSILFPFFYTFEILLHLIGEGGLFDSALERLWRLPSSCNSQILPLWVLYVYLPLSLLAARYRWAFVVLSSMATGVAIRLYV